MSARAGLSRPIRMRNAAAMALAAASGSTDAIGYLALGHVFTSAMTGNLALLGIGVAHRDGLRIGRVLVSLVAYTVGAALGARIARTPEPHDPVWPPAVSRALVVETAFFIAYAVSWWTLGPRPDVYGSAALLGLGATALGIQSSAMQRFGSGLGLNTTFLSGSLVRLVGQLATGRRYRDIHHHLLVLAGLVCGGCLGALLVLHDRVLAPLVPLAGVAFALVAARQRTNLLKAAKDVTRTVARAQERRYRTRTVVASRTTGAWNDMPPGRSALWPRARRRRRTRERTAE